MNDHKVAPDLTIGIVTIGYNRVDSMHRLLTRLNDCTYPSDEIPLVISLDNCGKTDVLDFATQFHWKHGEKRVIWQPERLGLRQHVLKCGTYMTEYDWDAQIVLEDDVYPSAAFYMYSLQAVEKYQNNDRIAGIALFGLPMNQTVRYPFVPVLSKYDAYFVQLAQSCGQVWMRKQWADFMEWYEQHKHPFAPGDGVPFNVRRWPESSWLKYHISYCVETDKWFSYPYQALTSNFSDIGSNTNVKTNVLQTHLQNEPREHYSFPELEDNAVFYDAWCENVGLAQKYGVKRHEICIDLYGAKKNDQKRPYWLTTLSAPYKVLDSYGLALMPMDMNVLADLPGNQIFLYDTSVPDTAPTVEDRDLSMWSFYNRIPFPDPMIWKLSRRMAKHVHRRRIKALVNPARLVQKVFKKKR